MKAIDFTETPTARRFWRVIMLAVSGVLLGIAVYGAHHRHYDEATFDLILSLYGLVLARTE